MTREERPVGITILAILAALSGIVYLVGAAFVAWLPAIIKMMPKAPPPEAMPFLVMFAGFFWLIALVLLVFAVVSFVLAYGLWKGKGWAWTMGIVLAAVGVLMGLMSLPEGAVNIVISLLILYYLTRPHVKRFFGKAPPELPPPP